MFHFYLHSNKHGGNLLRYGSGRLQAAPMLGYHACCCHAWGGGSVFSDRGREARLIICSAVLGANNRGTFAPTLEPRTHNHTNPKQCSFYNRKVKKKNCYQELVLWQRRSRGWRPWTTRKTGRSWQEERKEKGAELQGDPCTCNRNTDLPHSPGSGFFLSRPTACWAQPWTWYLGNNHPFLVARTINRKADFFQIWFTFVSLLLHFLINNQFILMTRIGKKDKARLMVSERRPASTLNPLPLHRNNNVRQLPQRRGSRRWPWQRDAAPWGTRDASSWSVPRSCVWVWLTRPRALWPAACTSSTWTLRRCRTQSRGQQTWCTCRSASACWERGRKGKKVHDLRHLLNKFMLESIKTRAEHHFSFLVWFYSNLKRVSKRLAAHVI